jgi:hypothetical protein
MAVIKVNFNMVNGSNIPVDNIPLDFMSLIHKLDQATPNGFVIFNDIAIQKVHVESVNLIKQYD